MALDGVVNEQGGTAFRHRIGDEGLEMAGKTGTSQVRRISVAEREQGVVKKRRPALAPTRPRAVYRLCACLCSAVCGGCRGGAWR